MPGLIHVGVALYGDGVFVVGDFAFYAAVRNVHVLPECFLADFPHAVAGNFSDFGRFECHVDQEFASLVGGKEHAVIFARLVLHRIFAVDVYACRGLVCLQAFRRILAANRVRFAFEVPKDSKDIQMDYTFNSYNGDTGVFIYSE